MLVALLLPLTMTGCVGTKPLKGGKATTVSKPAEGIEQTVVQSDNPAQTSKQDQEVVKVKTYTVPTGSRLEETRIAAPEAGPLVTNVQALVISAPMAVVEREEPRATLLFKPQPGFLTTHFHFPIMFFLSFLHIGPSGTDH